MTDPLDIDDPVERLVALGLDAAGIRWERGTPHHLDFYLPDLAVYVEVKQFHSERSIRQLSRKEAANTILIQGREAAKAFAHLIQKPERGYANGGPIGPPEGVRTEPLEPRSGPVDTRGRLVDPAMSDEERALISVKYHGAAGKD